MFSGHFHKRQVQGKIHYIGNAFPHNYADAWDDERGMMIQEWGKPPEYHTWPGAPRFRTLKLSQLLESPDEYMDNRTYLRITLDKDVSYEEANFIKDTFISTYDLRDVTLQPIKNSEHTEDNGAEIHFETIDQIVVSQLSALDGSFNKNVLIEIYNNL